MNADNPATPIPKVIQPNFTEFEMDFIGACFSQSVHALRGDMGGTIAAIQILMHLAHNNEKAVDALSRKILSLL